MSTFVLRTNYSTGDTTKTKRRRDQLLESDNDGVRFLFDLGFAWCYPGGPITTRVAPGAPGALATIYDVAERSNGVAQIATPGGVTFAGGGFDFSGAAKRGNYVEIPSAVAADLWAPIGGVSQRFLIAAYIKFPTYSAWSELSAGSYFPLFNWCGTDASPTAYYSTTPEIAYFGLKPDGSIQASFQTALNTMTTLNIGSTATALHVGKVAQVAMWRSSSGLGVRIKSAGGTSNATAVLNADNAADFSGSKGKMGIGNSIWPASGITNGGAWRLYRGFVENLVRSGRDPVTVLDADYTRTINRAVFS